MPSAEELTRALREIKDAMSHLHLACGSLDGQPTIDHRLSLIIRELDTEAGLLKLMIEEVALRRPKRLSRR
jgi:hypothetical protein